jgi:shikimate 5-dehydrogenase
MKNEDKPNFPMDKNDEIQSSSKKRKEHPVDMLANKTKTELLAEAHSAGIKGTSMG